MWERHSQGYRGWVAAIAITAIQGGYEAMRQGTESFQTHLLYCLMQSMPANKNPHLLSMICSRPGLTTSQAPAHQYFATPRWARTGILPILQLWKLRARAVTWLARGVQHCSRFPAPVVIHHPLLLHGQQVSQATAVFHRLGRPQLRPWFLCGEPEIQPGTGWRLIISLYPPSRLALNKYLLTDWLILALLPSFPGPLLQAAQPFKLPHFHQLLKPDFGSTGSVTFSEIWAGDRRGLAVRVGGQRSHEREAMEWDGRGLDTPCPRGSQTTWNQEQWALTTQRRYSWKTTYLSS